MKSIHINHLTGQQKQEIRDLEQQCRQEEPLSLSIPTEDGPDYFLCYEGEELILALFLFFPEETVCECGAFTRPSYRRKGYFLAMLDEALDFTERYEHDHDTEVDFCFLVDQHTPSAAAVLKALEADYWYSEYSMERPLTADDRSLQSPLTVTDAGDHLYTASLDDIVIGVCMVIPASDSVYFYGFEIMEAWRGKGYGEAFLLDMLALLAHQYTRVTLQVSGRNTPALSLYKKTGFSVTETLSYYLY